MNLLSTILEGITTITGYIGIAVQILEIFVVNMPKVVDFMRKMVDVMFDKIGNKEYTPEEAREIVVASTLSEFHGSDAVITEQDVRTILEQLVKIGKAKRGIFDYTKEEKAVAKGYVELTELEKARKAWPGFQPLD